jgi:hypothetical protein
MADGNFEQNDQTAMDNLATQSRKTLSNDADLSQPAILADGPKSADKILPTMEIAQLPDQGPLQRAIAQDFVYDPYKAKLAGEDKIDPQIMANAQQAHKQALGAVLDPNRGYWDKAQGYVNELEALKTVPPAIGGRLQAIAQRSLGDCMFKDGHTAEAVKNWDSAKISMDIYLKARLNETTDPKERTMWQNGLKANQSNTEMRHAEVNR